MGAEVFLIQGVVSTGLALALLLFPGSVARVWPWPVTPVLAQLYAGPLLSYGIGSLLHARARTWMEVRAVVTGMLAFTVATLIVSLVHRDLFSIAQPGDWLWFSAFGAAAVVLVVLTARALQQRRESPLSPDRV